MPVSSRSKKNPPTHPPASSASPNSMLWGGRFSSGLDDLAFSYSQSFSIDRRLFREDIEGSLAHITMLCETGILSKSEYETLKRGLHQILNEFLSGVFPPSQQEDIHMCIEARLKELVGAVAGKLHTARSRNDQVALDERLFMRRATREIIDSIDALQMAFIGTAEAYQSALLPGYTHLQRAQPSLLAHHLLAYVEMLERDKERFRDVFKRINRLPLGAAAFGGTSFPIDRKRVAQLLGFDDVLDNSIDAVSDRDVVIEVVSGCALIMMHLSRFSEECILWTTHEFGFATIADAFTTGSSIMPQKKNPDMAELQRGKTGRVYGHLMALLTLMKGLPLAYNRDLQEDKVPLFEAVDMTVSSLRILSEMVRTMTFHTEKIYASMQADYSTATELADFLAEKGIPFREAHDITGKIVAYALGAKKGLEALTIKELKAFSPRFDESIVERLKPEFIPTKRTSWGAASHASVTMQLNKWKKKLGIKKNL